MVIVENVSRSQVKTMNRMRLCGTLLLSLALLAPVVAAQQRPFEQVVSELRSPDAGTRLSALKLLADSGYPEAALPIAPLLSDPDARIRREAMSTELGLFLGMETARKRVAFVIDRRDPSAAARAFEGNWAAMPAGRVPIDVVTGLLTLLGDQNASTRVEAAYALAVLAQIEGIPPDPAYKAVVDALAERMGDREPRVRIAAARAAGRVFRRCPAGCGLVALDRVGDAMVRLLDDSDVAIQAAAMEGLGELRYERAVKALADIFGYYRSGEMAFGALDTLARIGHASSVPLFAGAVTSKDPNFRRAAAEGLARSGDKDSAPRLDGLAAAERDPSVVLALAFAQQRSGRGQHVPRFVQALGDRILRAQAQDYLIELGPPVAAALATSLAPAQPEARLALLEVLGVTGSAAEVPSIEPYQDDPDPRIAAAAQRALARIRAFALVSRP